MKYQARQTEFADILGQFLRSYDVCFLKYGVWETKFFVVLGHILTFYLTIDPKNQNLEKNAKKARRNYPLTHVYHKWRSFWAIVCPLTLQKNPKNQKTPGGIIIYDQMMYNSWDMVHNRQKDGRTDGRKKWHIEVVAPP